MHYSADKLKEYAQSFQYLKDSNWVEKWEKEDRKKNAKHVMFSFYFYFQNHLNLSREDFIDVIFDDFSDIDIP